VRGSTIGLKLGVKEGKEVKFELSDFGREPER
jgi:hypothetical protein